MHEYRGAHLKSQDTEGEQHSNGQTDTKPQF